MKFHNKSISSNVLILEQIREGKETIIITRDHVENEKWKQKALEEQKKYTRRCYLEHLNGKQIIKEKAKRRVRKHFS